MATLGIFYQIFLVIFSSESDEEEAILVQSKYTFQFLMTLIANGVLCFTETKKSHKRKRGMW